jgi:hypothetical protein
LHRLPPAIPVISGRSALQIIIRDFSAPAPHLPHHIVLPKHFAQDDRLSCQEYQQRALQNDAINLPKLRLAMNPPLCASCAGIFTGKNA